MKGTISVRLNKACWRLVSYYSVANVHEHRLLRPSEWSKLAAILLREDLGRELQCWTAPRDSALELHEISNYVNPAYFLVGGVSQFRDQEAERKGSNMRCANSRCCAQRAEYH